MTKKLVIHLMLERSASVVNVDGLAVTQIQINHNLLSQCAWLLHKIDAKAIRVLVVRLHASSVVVVVVVVWS